MFKRSTYWEVTLFYTSAFLRLNADQIREWRRQEISRHLCSVVLLLDYGTSIQKVSEGVSSRDWENWECNVKRKAETSRPIDWSNAKANSGRSRHRAAKGSI